MADAALHSDPAGRSRELGSGIIEEGRHRLPIRVYYEDTDAGGIVYYASYLRFAERARTEMLRLAGIEQDRLRAESGLSLAVRSCAVDYLKPARLDDRLDIVSQVSALGGASLVAAQDVFCSANLLARLSVRLACIGRSGRAVRLPLFLRAALEPFSSTA